MNLTGNQLAALMYVAKEVVNVDQVVTDEESAVFTNVFSKFGLDSEERTLLIEAAQNYDAEDAIEVVKNLGPDQKEFASAIVTLLIAADGELADSELDVYTNLLKVCGLPYLTIERAIEVLE